MLETKEISFFHGPGAPPLLQDVSVEIEKGETLAILGPNGSGKTTLIRLMLGLIKPITGEALIDDDPVRSLRPMDRAKKLAYVPQDYISGASMTVFESILLGRRPYISWGPSKNDFFKAKEAMEALGLSDLSQRPMQTLSGGQRQKAVLARALAQDTPYLLLDEPTGNLDLRHQVEVLECLSKRAKEGLSGIAIAMHDLNLASHYAGKALLLIAGGKPLYGPTKEIFTKENLSMAYGINMLFTEKSPGGERIWFPEMP
jgi:iron complex transport system ATP-binding protein